MYVVEWGFWTTGMVWIQAHTHKSQFLVSSIWLQVEAQECVLTSSTKQAYLLLPLHTAASSSGVASLPSAA